MNFYVSSTAFRGLSVEEMISLCERESIRLEFSSGMKFRKDMNELFINANIPRIPHNYFPAPEVPFVLNLASADPEIRKKSISHCLNGLKLSKTVSANFFSAHAGFCLDPQPDELGKKLEQPRNFDKELHWSIFTKSVEEILTYAEKMGVHFLVENNVTAKFNLHPTLGNPLLCSAIEDTSNLLKSFGTNNSFGILLDTGHLKVSANTLNFSVKDYINNFHPFVQAIHHSDNDGIFDSNMPITNDYWFLDYIHLFNHCTHILEVHQQTVSEIRIQENIMKGRL